MKEYNNLYPIVTVYGGSICNDEVSSLVDDLTLYYNDLVNRDSVDALFLSNNIWVQVRNGRKRVDTCINLSNLIKIDIFPEILCFMLRDESVFVFEISDDFFYFLDNI